MLLLLKRIFSWINLNILPLPFVLLSSVVPPKNNIWVFGSWFGSSFSDNSKYLYLFIRQNYPDIRAIWLTRNQSVISALRADGMEAYHAYSPKGFYYCLKAKIAVCSMLAHTDLNRFSLSNKTKVIHLWHGAPLKKIPEDIQPQQGSWFIKLLIKILKINRVLFRLPRIDFVPSLSEYDQHIYRRCFSPYTHITGFPRNDILLTRPSDPFAKSCKEMAGVEKIILYMPTFRGNEKNKHVIDYFEYGFNKEKMTQILEKHNALLLIKLHYVDINNVLPEQIESRHIRLLNDADIKSDVYPLLSHTDVLITDYSSVYFDFLLTERPIIFSPFDLEQYQTQDRGFYLDYHEATSGPKAHNWQELADYLAKMLSQPESYAKERHTSNMQFNHYRDADSSKRIAEYIFKTFF